MNLSHIQILHHTLSFFSKILSLSLALTHNLFLHTYSLSLSLSYTLMHEFSSYKPEDASAIEFTHLKTHKVSSCSHEAAEATITRNIYFVKIVSFYKYTIRGKTEFISEWDLNWGFSVRSQSDKPLSHCPYHDYIFVNLFHPLVHRHILILVIGTLYLCHKFNLTLIFSTSLIV